MPYTNINTFKEILMNCALMPSFTSMIYITLLQMQQNWGQCYEISYEGNLYHLTRATGRAPQYLPSKPVTEELELRKFALRN